MCGAVELGSFEFETSERRIDLPLFGQSHFFSLPSSGLVVPMSAKLRFVNGDRLGGVAFPNRRLAKLELRGNGVPLIGSNESAHAEEPA